MAEVNWTVEAQRWLEDIFEFIALDNPDAAMRVVLGIYERAQILRDFPELDIGINRPSDMCGFCFTDTIGSHA